MNYSATTGSIKFYDKEKKYGYIYRGEELDDVFFHISECDFFNYNNIQPEIRLKVKFEVAISEKGFQAVKIELR